MTTPEQPWSIPVVAANVPEGGLHLDVAADAPTRAAVAKLAGVNAVSRLAATFDVARFGRGGLHVTGAVSGTVEQSCVVSLEPLTSEIREAIDLFFTPPAGPGGGAAAAIPESAEEAVIYPDEADPPEPLVNGIADLGRVATEFLVLAIDPYPRKPDANFVAPAVAEVGDNPFAALAALKKDRNEGE